MSSAMNVPTYALAFSLALFASRATAQATDGKDHAAPKLPTDLPETLDYSPGDPTILPNYRLVTSPRPELFRPGVVFFGLSYAVALVNATVAKFHAGAAYLPIPIAGPLIADQHRSCGANAFGCHDSYPGPGSLELYSLAQGVGAVLVAASFVFPTTRFVRKDLAVALTPSADPRGVSIGVSGQF
jgi:hypothetical protein